MAAHRRLQALWPALPLVLALWLALGPSLAVAQPETPPPPTGTYYVVRSGDTWSIIARRNGLTLAGLRAANPTLVRPNDVLIIGDRLFIPAGRAAAPVQTATLDSGTPGAGTPALSAPAPGATATPPGRWYTVKAGDTWQTVSRDTGVPVLELWKANPSALTSNRWLYIGNRLWIPQTGATRALSATRASEQVTATATAATSTVTATVTTATPTTPAPTAKAQPTFTATPTATRTATRTKVPTATRTPTATRVAAAAAKSATPAPTATASPAPASNGPACPAQFDDYPTAIAAYLNAPKADIEGLRAWLTSCGALRSDLGSVTEAGIQSAETHDVVVAIHPPKTPGPAPAGRLAVLHALPKGGYVLAGVAEGVGRVEVLQIADLNADGKTDIAWTDTTCDGSSCASTLFVDSWDGTAYRSWIADQPVVPSASYRFQPVPGSQAQAILIQSDVAGAMPQLYVSRNGGIYQSIRSVLSGSTGNPPTPAATGPAIAATRVVTAPAVAATSPVTPTAALQTTAPVATPVPTIMATQTKAAPTQAAAAAQASPATPRPAAPAATARPAGCLADQVLAANQAFDTWTTQGFDPAIKAYQDVLNGAAQACGVSQETQTLLRDFVRVRLVVSFTGNGKASQTPPVKDQIGTAGLKSAAEAFLNSYADSHSIIQACRDMTDYATAHPETWQFMTELAPKFAADDLCPLAK